jgi:hypothetical protein
MKYYFQFLILILLFAGCNPPKSAEFSASSSPSSYFLGIKPLLDYNFVIHKSNMIAVSQNGFIDHDNLLRAFVNRYNEMESVLDENSSATLDSGKRKIDIEISKSSWRSNWFLQIDVIDNGDEFIFISKFIYGPQKNIESQVKHGLSALKLVKERIDTLVTQRAIN